jgi:hypothetical protein
MKLTAKGSYTYIPEFNENRTLPKGQQIAVEIIRPKVEERDALFHFDYLQEPSSSGTSLKQANNVGLALRRHVGAIVNLSADYPDGEKQIISGKDLAEAPLFGAAALVNELFLEVISDKLREDEKKISESPSS